MKIKCLVAVRNAGGTPDVYPVIVTCNQEGYDDGQHYDAAVEAASEAGYDATGSTLVYDENDGPAWLFNHFDWEKARRVEVKR
jgi:hypothetical protein